jgi:hypothetical protein
MDANGNSITIGNGGADNIIVNATDSIGLNGSQSVALSCATGNINLIPFNNGTTELGAVYINKASADVGDGILNVGTINYTTLNPPIPAYDLSAVLTAGNIATNSITLNNGVINQIKLLFPSASAFNPQITLTDGTTTNTIDKNGYTTRNTIANATYYLNFSDNFSTGTASIEKTAGLNCNPSTSTITAIGGFAGTATNAAAVSLTSDNSPGTYFIPFSKTTTATGNTLYIDNTTTPLTYDPSSSLLAVGELQLTNTQVPTTFTAGVLTIDCSNSTYRSFGFEIPANMTGLNLNNSRNNGVYTIVISNGTGTYTISNVLTGTTNRTSYLTTKTISIGQTWIMTVKVQTFTTPATTIINCVSLEQFV